MKSFKDFTQKIKYLKKINLIKPKEEKNHIETQYSI